MKAQTIYWIRRYSQVSPLAGKATKAFKRAACSDGECALLVDHRDLTDHSTPTADMAETFTELAEKLAQELHNVVLVDAVRCSSMNNLPLPTADGLLTGQARQRRTRQLDAAPARAHHDESRQGERSDPFSSDML